MYAVLSRAVALVCCALLGSSPGFPHARAGHEADNGLSRPPGLPSTQYSAVAYISDLDRTKPKEPAITARDREHWSFRSPSRPPQPAVADASWCRNPLDAFVLAQLTKAGLRPAPEADRATLLRRVTLNLTGLPPTAEELEAFLHDSRPDAYERVVERLLQSPHYGEHWARHWLDVVRYAESNGYEVDGERPHAWRYRDYVIAAFNRDEPYDAFLREQVAGDLLAGKQPGGSRTELLVAAGMHRCGPVHLVSGNTDPLVNRQEVLTEMTTGVGSAFLGLTVGCARCHDHKFDPFSQAGYYRLQAFFAGTQPHEEQIAGKAEQAAYEARVAELDRQLEPLNKQVAAIDAPYRQRLTEAKKAQLEPAYREALALDAKKRNKEQAKLAADAQILIKVSWDEILEALTPEDRARRAELRARIHALQALKPSPPAQAWTVGESKEVPETHVLRRGDPHQPGAAVQPGFPRVLSGMGDAAPGRRLDRLDLANWLTRPDHPLTARVLVNRLWQYHFGRGIVATPNDWGIRGERPTHPELLDWLACELVQQGWSIKHIQRMIVLSSTYRQAGRSSDPNGPRVDPDDRLLWHMPRQRLHAEALRDATLQVTGSLYPRLGGPMVRVPLEQEVYDLIFTEGEPDGLWPVTPDPREHTRRSIYLFAKRNVRLPLLEAFDQPDTLTSCPVRAVSTYAPQALILLNGPFMQEQSKRFASRLLAEAGPDPERQIDRAYELALGRAPSGREKQMARDFLPHHTKLLRQRKSAGGQLNAPEPLPPGTDAAVAAALADFCLALLNRNEFLYIP